MVPVVCLLERKMRQAKTEAALKIECRRHR
jgi:hypothetical protein